MTIFDVRIPGLSMTVVQADGNDVEPVTVDEFRISVAETYDVILRPGDASAYTIFAQSEDRTGYARGTLALRPGMSATIPPMDPRPMRTMADMGMGKMDGMNMSGMSAPKAKPQGSTSSSSGGSAHKGMAGINMGEMPGMEMGTEEAPALPMEQTRLRPTNPVQLELGPQVDNVAMNTGERLSTPGGGLEGNGRRVLTYADLRARYRGTDPRPPAREFEFHLTGNMERFIWGFNGRKFSENQPVELKLGERVRFVLINDSMMEHPIHLHGLWSELENGQGEFRPYKHTLNVKPAERLSFLVSADTPGHWAFHCHLAYHMEAGMFLTVVVS
jgi:CopA family copper-resistance protein